MNMPKTGLRGSYSLNNETIDAKVTRKNSAGAYALGHVETEKKNEEERKIFYVNYVGRSDDDINGRLKEWVGKYPRFKFEYYDSPRAAFKKECSLYHGFGEKETLDNDKHPERSKNKNWKCPRCDIFNEENE